MRSSRRLAYSAGVMSLMSTAHKQGARGRQSAKPPAGRPRSPRGRCAHWPSPKGHVTALALPGVGWLLAGCPPA
eukprot:1108068-Pelagomonas_calceolata.AAC.9